MYGDIEVSQIILMGHCADARDSEDMRSQDKSMQLYALNTSM